MSSLQQRDPLLLNDWHVVGRSADLREGELGRSRVLGEDLVIWRAGGRANVWQDLCVHRGSRLSLGRVADQRLTCAYHGWTYDVSGQCVKFPSHPEQRPPPTAHVATYKTKEVHGSLCACLGEPANDVPEFN